MDWGVPALLRGTYISSQNNAPIRTPTYNSQIPLGTFFILYYYYGAHTLTHAQMHTCTLYSPVKNKRMSGVGNYPIRSTSPEVTAMRPRVSRSEQSLD